MEISVKLKRTKVNYGHVNAIASVVIDNAICINNIQVIETDTKLYINFPCKKTKFGYRDIAHPINKETREALEKAILEEYKKEGAI